MSEHWTNGVATLHQADARAMPLPDASVHMCVTSPPYWGLRDYGLGQWQGGDAECGHKRQQGNLDTVRSEGPPPANTNHAQEPWPGGICGHCGAIQQPAGIGLEPTLGEWVQNIVAVMREVKRVLRDDGTCWLNLGDAYASGTKGTGGNSPKQNSHPGSFSPDPIRIDMEGLASKQLMGQPWRAAFALQDDGWILRKAIVWHKPNPMPESATDRPTSSYEMVFLLAKQGRYFYDAEAIRQPRVPHSPTLGFRPMQGGSPYKNQKGAQGNSIYNPDAGEYVMPAEEQIGGTANARDVWTIPTQGRPDAHFATFPDALPRRCILAGTSERGVCADCGAPWVRVVEKQAGIPNPIAGQAQVDATGGAISGGTAKSTLSSIVGTTQTLGWQPTCGCNAATVPATVLDPFAGSGTTLAVAQALGRQSIGLDLNPEYLEIAKKYINRADGITLPMVLAQ